MKKNHIISIITLVVAVLGLFSLQPSGDVAASPLLAVTLTPSLDPGRTATPSLTPWTTLTFIPVTYPPNPTRTPWEFPTLDPRPTRTRRWGPSETPEPSITPTSVINTPVSTVRPSPGGQGNAGIIGFWAFVGGFFAVVMLWLVFPAIKTAGVKLGERYREIEDPFGFFKTGLHPDHLRAIVIILVTLILAAIIFSFLAVNFF